MKISDTIMGAGFVGAGAAIFAATLGFPRLEDGSPGPSLFPRILAVLMIGFGACLAFPAALGRRTKPPDATPVLTGPHPGGVFNALLVFAAIIVFMLASPVFGFLLTTAVILLGLMWWLGTPLPRAAAVAIGLDLFVYVIFGKILRVPLPLGFLWF
ncbi:MAG TPA: tripartite tricarboxylate transporter TctB family protein [Methylomirabilota bacterium]|nr:tripartite tricarboxylate transporter TctB family protein [Methylomirabilota bacterium]